MNLKTFSVHGDHPVLQRVDEYHLDAEKAEALRRQLNIAGYDNIRVCGEEFSVVTTVKPGMSPAKYLWTIAFWTIVGFILYDLVFQHNPFNRTLYFPAGIAWSAVLLQFFYSRIKNK